MVWIADCDLAEHKKAYEGYWCLMCDTWVHSVKEKSDASGFVIPKSSGVPGGGFGVFKPPLEIPKAFQNGAKLNPIVKTVKNCWI